MDKKLIDEMTAEEYMETFLNSVDYIQVYNNVLSKDECKYFIEQHNYLRKRGFSKKGKIGIDKRYDVNKKNSEDIYLNILNKTIDELDYDDKDYKEILNKTTTLAQKLTYCVSDYLVKVGVFGDEFVGTGIKTFLEVGNRMNNDFKPILASKFHIREICLRKYDKDVGAYFAVHMDHQRGTLTRLAAGILYLNTVKKGGETCFPVLGRKIKPKAGDYVIFPSYYTHLHYGATSLSDDRYIVATHVRWSGVNEQEIKENKDG